jgi:hypothetical protein
MDRNGSGTLESFAETNGEESIMMNRRCYVAGALCAALLVWGGCVGYKVGSMLPSDIRTVHVPTFINQTSEPLLEIYVTRAVIQKIQQDGSLKLAGPDEADAVLTVHITGFQLQALAFNRDRRTAAEEYRMYITSNVLMTRRVGGETIAESPDVTGNATFPVSGDLTSSKQRAYDEASEDLANLIVQRLVETWR